MESIEKDNARNQAKAQLESIREMLARLEHCESGCDEYAENEFCDLFKESDIYDLGEYHDIDAAREAIEEDPLSVETRSGWHTPGEQGEDEQFMILLCTGGPAVRIMGELDEHGQADRAWLEYQDWGTPWTQYFESPSDGSMQDALVEYANHFLGF